MTSPDPSRSTRALAASILLMATSAYAADPAVVPAPDLKPGDAWTFDRSMQLGTGQFTERRLDFRVEHVSGDTMVVGIKQHGSPVDFEDHVMGSDWSQHRIVDGQQSIIGKPFSFPLSIGKTWTNDYVDPIRHSLQTSATHHVTYKVTGWEDVSTQAGTFHAIKIESDDKLKMEFMGASAAVGGTVSTAGGSTATVQSGKTGPHTEYRENFQTLYYAPQAKYFVKTVEDQFNSESIRNWRQTDVLVSFTPAP